MLFRRLLVQVLHFSIFFVQPRITFITSVQNISDFVSLFCLKVMNWYTERQDRLEDALTNLKDNAELLEKLLKWLEQSENTLQERDSRQVPDDIDRINKLLEEHQVRP